MNTQSEDRDALSPHCSDPFPEPQTIPSGWDLSGLVSTPQPDTVTEAIDSAESGGRAGE